MSAGSHVPGRAVCLHPSPPCSSIPSHHPAIPFANMNRPKMHRALDCWDILNIVYAFLDSPSLLQIALTQKQFAKPALQKRWAVIKDLKHLLSVWPSDASDPKKSFAVRTSASVC